MDPNGLTVQLFIRTGLVVCPREENNHFLVQELPRCLLALPSALPVCRMTGYLFYMFGIENNKTYIAESVLIRGFELSSA